jgi:hypothetical protein
VEKLFARSFVLVTFEVFALASLLDIDFPAGKAQPNASDSKKWLRD